MMERFTDRARKSFALANNEAQRFNHEYISTEHILLGLVKEGSGVAAKVLQELGVDLRVVRLEVEKLTKPGPDLVTLGKLPQTPRAKQVISYAIEEARLLNHNYVGTEHLLLGLVRETDGIAAQVLLNLGVKLEAAREKMLAILQAQEEANKPKVVPKITVEVPWLLAEWNEQFKSLGIAITLNLTLVSFKSQGMTLELSMSELFRVGMQSVFNMFRALPSLAVAKTHSWMVTLDSPKQE